VPTPTPTPACVAGATLAIDGYVTWGRVPVVGARIELRGEHPIGEGALFGAAVTDANGYFMLRGIDRSVRQEIDFPAQSVYLQTRYPVFPPVAACVVEHLGAAPNSFNVNKAITLKGIDAGTTVSSAPLTITWDPMPTTSVYCVSLLSNDTGNWVLAGGDCPDVPSSGEKNVGLDRSYTVPALPPGRYQFSVGAYTTGVLNGIGWGTRYFTVR